MLASSTGVSTVYGYHSVLCLMHFVLSVLLPPIRSSASSVLSFSLVSVFFWRPLQVQRKCYVSSPNLFSASCSPLVATLGWRLPIAAPFPLRHSLFPSSSMSFFHEATSFSRCKGSMPAHFMGTGLYAYGQCFDENLPFSFHGQQKEYLHKKSLAHPLSARLFLHL